MNDTREKCEIFKNYIFICCKSFNPDNQTAFYLESVSFFIILFPNFVISLHSKRVEHVRNVLNRVTSLKQYLSISADWFLYALLDDIVDGFVTHLHGLEMEVDSIDDLVLVLRESEQSDMLRRIGVI
jgi:magnesium transporter